MRAMGLHLKHWPKQVLSGRVGIFLCPRGITNFLTHVGKNNMPVLQIKQGLM